MGSPNQPISQNGQGLLLSDELMFISRITGTARDLGVSIKPARNMEALLGLARQQPPSGVLVDLANPGLQIGQLIKDLAALCAGAPRVIAYGSHVDAAGLQAARSAGCWLVLPRSKFVEELPRALPGWVLAREPK